MMYYYKLESSHWKGLLEFKSKSKLDLGQCFRITSHDGTKNYPTRFKVISISTQPDYTGQIVEIFSIDLTVDQF